MFLRKKDQNTFDKSHRLKSRLNNTIENLRLAILDQANYDRKKAEAGKNRQLNHQESNDLLEGIYKDRASAFNNFLKSTLDHAIKEELSKVYLPDGKAYSQDQICEAFVDQNAFYPSKKSQIILPENMSIARARDNVAPAVSYGNHTPMVNGSFLTSMGYESAIGQKVLTRLATLVLGQGFEFESDDRPELAYQLNQDLDDFGIDAMMVDLMMQTFCYGGCSLMPIVDNWSGEDYADEFYYNNLFMRKGTLNGFNVVNRQYTTPMQWNSWDARQQSYYSSPYYLQYGYLLHQSRFQMTTTGRLPEFLSPSYLLYGVPILQTLYKYFLSIDVALSSINNVLIGNSIFIYEQSQNSNSDIEIGQFLSSRTNPTGVLSILQNEKVYAVSIPLAHYEDIYMANFHLIPTFIGDSVGVFMGNSSAGNKNMVQKEGSQDAKNLKQSSIMWKKRTNYLNVRNWIGKMMQLNRFGKIDPVIKMKDKPLDEAWYMQQLDAANLEADYMTKLIGNANAIGMDREQILEIFELQLKHSQVSPIKNQVQDIEFDISNEDDFMETNPNNKVPSSKNKTKESK